MIMEATDIDADAVNRETNEVLDRLDDIRTEIARSNQPVRPGVFHIRTTVQQTHVRMRPLNLILSADNAGAVNITVRFGQEQFVYSVIGPLTLAVAPPIEVVERGVDIIASVSAGALRAAYFQYEPE